LAARDRRSELINQKSKLVTTTVAETLAYLAFPAADAAFGSNGTDSSL
jgi:hypothetical protein